MSKSKLEDMVRFYMQIKKIPKAVEEYRFDNTRRFRFDFAYPELKIGVECEGGVWVSGRHSRGAGFTKDCEKYNLAVLQGWRILRYTTSNIQDCINDINKLIGENKFGNPELLQEKTNENNMQYIKRTV